jgi:hypothetical protein
MKKLKSKNRPTSKHLSHSICKWCQFTPYLSSRPSKNPFMTWKLSNFSSGSQIWFKLCEMTCEITIINFKKVKNHFNHFWNIFSFLNTPWHVFFSCKYTPSYQNIKKKWLDFLKKKLGLCFTIICNNIVNCFCNFDMV